MTLIANNKQKINLIQWWHNFLAKFNIVTKTSACYMEKKTIFLELPAEMIDRIDQKNSIGDRSLFISELLEKQLEQKISTMSASTELTVRMDEIRESAGDPGEIGLINSKGATLGKFNINTPEGFEELALRISEISEDPLVRMRARHWRW